LVLSVHCLSPEASGDEVERGEPAVSICLLPSEPTAASGSGAAAEFPAALSPWFTWFSSLGTYPENLTYVIMRFHRVYDENTYCWD
jgi:hypothetical protein